jgi:hypothetical protein
MQRFGIILLSLIVGTNGVLLCHADEPGITPNEGATFGFDTPASTRPRTSLRYYQPDDLSVPVMIPNQSSRDAAARARLRPPLPYVYPFDGNLGFSFTWQDFWCY